MKLFSYLSVAVLLLSSIALAAYSPDLLSALIVGLMCIIALAGCIHGLLPTISITGGLLNGQKSIRKASETEGSSAWVAALQIERFFQQKTLDRLFEDYREKVQHQRETGRSSAILTKCSMKTCWRCTHGKASSRSCPAP